MNNLRIEAGIHKVSESGATRTITRVIMVQNNAIFSTSDWSWYKLTLYLPCPSNRSWYKLTLYLPCPSNRSWYKLTLYLPCLSDHGTNLLYIYLVRWFWYKETPYSPCPSNNGTNYLSSYSRIYSKNIWLLDAPFFFLLPSIRSTLPPAQVTLMTSLYWNCPPPSLSGIALGSPPSLHPPTRTLHTTPTATSLAGVEPLEVGYR